jgi:hypothetical protein
MVEAVNLPYKVGLSMVEAVNLPYKVGLSMVEVEWSARPSRSGCSVLQWPTWT